MLVAVLFKVDSTTFGCSSLLSIISLTFSIAVGCLVGSLIGLTLLCANATTGAQDSHLIKDLDQAIQMQEFIFLLVMNPL